MPAISRSPANSSWTLRSPVPPVRSPQTPAARGARRSGFRNRTTRSRRDLRRGRRERGPDEARRESGAGLVIHARNHRKNPSWPLSETRRGLPATAPWRSQRRAFAPHSSRLGRAGRSSGRGLPPGSRIRYSRARRSPPRPTGRPSRRSARLFGPDHPVVPVGPTVKSPVDRARSRTGAWVRSRAAADHRGRTTPRRSRRSEPEARPKAGAFCEHLPDRKEGPRADDTVSAFMPAIRESEAERNSPRERSVEILGHCPIDAAPATEALTLGSVATSPTE